MSFPKHFLWGAATSAFQYEGANLEDGKGWTVADERCQVKSQIQADSSVASDGYHHLEEDVKLMKDLGLTSYRFSISWARIFPKGDGEINNAGVIYYQKLINLLNENHIEPVVTLLHFDIPWALVEKYEGFVSRKCIDAFEKYCRTCFDLFGDKVKYWLTINEQNVMALMSDMLGLKIDDTKLSLKLSQCNYHMYLASAKAVIACHEMCPHALIGPCVSYPTFYAETCHPDDVALAYDTQDMMAFAPMETYVNGIIDPIVMNKWIEDKTVPEILENDEKILKEGVADYLGVNWYCTQTVGVSSKNGGFNIGLDVDIKKNPFLEYGKWNWSYDPTALKMALEECYARFRKPIMICENGWSEIEEVSDGKIHDLKRIEYLHDHIEQMEKAINEGVDLIGYQHWSFVDILSSSQGFEKRYGLIFVDRDNFNIKECQRIKKDSFYYYQTIIKNNGLGEENGKR